MLEVGKAYLFMTMTFYWTGKLVDVKPADLTITDAAQVFDLGELENAINTGDVNICQAVPKGVNVTLSRNGTTVVEWPKPLIRKSKRG
jgi:hypothetical protein